MVAARGSFKIKNNKNNRRKPQMQMAGVRLAHGTVKRVLMTSENYSISFASALQICMIMARLL